MATRIIEPGTDVYRVTCGECGCRFTYERSDVHTNYVAVVRQVIDCPHCGKQVTHFGSSGDKWPEPSRPVIVEDRRREDPGPGGS